MLREPARAGPPGPLPVSTALSRGPGRPWAVLVVLSVLSAIPAPPTLPVLPMPTASPVRPAPPDLPVIQPAHRGRAYPPMPSPPMRRLNHGRAYRPTVRLRPGPLLECPPRGASRGRTRSLETETRPDPPPPQWGRRSMRRLHRSTSWGNVRPSRSMQSSRWEATSAGSFPLCGRQCAPCGRPMASRSPASRRWPARPPSSSPAARSSPTTSTPLC